MSKREMAHKLTELMSMVGENPCSACEVISNIHDTPELLEVME
ncbi:hypothetical protein [Phascolarctobacterium sp.]